MEFEARWVALIATPILIRALQTSAVGRHAKIRRGKVTFGAPGLAGLCAVGVLMGAAITVGGWSQDGRAFTTVIGIAMMVGGALMWPPTLVVDETGVAAVFVWRPAKRLRYTEIEYASRVESEVYVVGKNKEIKHTEYHVDSGRFESELRKRGVKA